MTPPRPMPARARTTLATFATVALLAAACAAPADPDHRGEAADAATAPPAPVVTGGGPSPMPALAGVAFAELVAWQDTRVGLPPLRVVRPDSVASLVAWVDARRGGWTPVEGALSGIALPIVFYGDTATIARLGMMETAHGQGGHLVTWEGTRPWTRPATAAELDQLRAYFGIGTVIIP